MKLWSRNAILIAVQCFVVAAVACGQAQKVTITISAPQAEVKVGAPILLHIVMTNLSQQDIYVPKNAARARAERYYFISVFDSEGNAPPTTQYGKAIRYPGAEAMSRLMVILKPGEKLEEDSTISDIFDMKSAGTYKVIVTRPSPLEDNVILKSNEISITVTN
jgi:hypothetical protein